MTTFSKMVVMLLTLTIVAVLVSSGQTAALIKGMGNFLGAMAKKVTSA